MALTPNRAARVYDRIGRIQDWQAFYEDRAVDRLLAEADLGRAASVLEFGCGTGRLAARMLTRLPTTAGYLGVDVSPVMVRLAAARVARWADRARVTLVDGTLPLHAPDRSADRIVSTFVFDLLEDSYARDVLDDLRRIITPDGLLCLASLTFGASRPERMVSTAWSAISRRTPALVGGCRPISLRHLLAEAEWRIRHHSTVHAWGLVTEVVVAIG